MKKIIRLTESDLHEIIKKSVKRILREEKAGHVMTDRPAFSCYSNQNVANYLEDVINNRRRRSLLQRRDSNPRGRSRK